MVFPQQARFGSHPHPQSRLGWSNCLTHRVKATSLNSINSASAGNTIDRALLNVKENSISHKGVTGFHCCVDTFTSFKAPRNYGETCVAVKVRLEGGSRRSLRRVSGIVCDREREVSNNPLTAIATVTAHILDSKAVHQMTSYRTVWKQGRSHSAMLASCYQGASSVRVSNRYMFMVQTNSQASLGWAGEWTFKDCTRIHQSDLHQLPPLPMLGDLCVSNSILTSVSEHRQYMITDGVTWIGNTWSISVAAVETMSILTGYWLHCSNCFSAVTYYVTGSTQLVGNSGMPLYLFVQG